MLPERKIEEIRNWLKKTKRPVFFFDNDADGFCSFQLLRRYIGVGEGVPVKTSELNINLIGKLYRVKPDIVFITDVPKVSQEFIDNANRPIVWIDHHEAIKLDKVYYYNPRAYNKDSYFPTTYVCYKTVKENLWIASIGCIADYFIPDYFEDFKKQFPKLADIKTNDPGDILYKTRLGELIKIINFCLKGKGPEAKEFILLFNKIEDPYEILEKKTYAGKLIYNRFQTINKHYEKLIERAMNFYDKKSKIFVFTYPSEEFSFSGELSTELIYNNKKAELVVVGREKKEEIVFSIRSRNPELSQKARKAIEELGGYSGGHPNAFGGSIKMIFLNKFIELMGNKTPIKEFI